MRKFSKTIINTVLVSIILYCSYNIYIKFNEYKMANDTYNELKDTYLGQSNYIDSNEDKTIKEDLSHLNNDFRFWVSVDNTNIDYPVVQGKDNYFYLYKDFYGNKLDSGCIFMDYRNTYENDKNTIIYGHNMKNDTMFSQLENFKDEEFFSQNNKIRVFKDDTEYIYEVFSVYYTSVEYDYLITKFENDMDFENYIKDVCNKSLYKSQLEASSFEKIITLSTCSYEFNNARTVVHGKLIDVK